MPTAAASTRSTRARDARAFTLLEMLFSVLVIGVLVGLLVVGLQSAGVFARGTVERQAVASVALGVQQFRDQFGFPPPLIKDRATAPQVIIPQNGRNFFAVYEPSVPADQLILRPPVRAPDPTSVNPFEDIRYSEVSLAVYLCGANDTPYSATLDLPIDGVKGVGFFPPRRDGGFDIPKDLLTANTTKRVAARSEPLVKLSTPNLKLGPIPDPAQPSNPGPFFVHPRLKDRNDVPLRYYTWLSGREQPANSGNYVIEDIADYNIPPLVAFVSTPDAVLPDERDPSKNIALRSAKWAVVGAGPNKVFGDEPLAEIAAVLGKPAPSAGDAPSVRKFRALAAYDNVVEVGQ